MSIFENGCDASAEACLRLGRAWKEDRYDAITGTDVGKILGQDLDCSRQRLFNCKLDRVDTAAEAPPLVQTLMRYGREMEPFARDDLIQCLHENRLWESAFGVQRWNHVPGIIRSTRKAYLAGTPDLVHVQTTATKSKVFGISEIKTHSFPHVEQAIPYPNINAIPVKHWLQLQTYLEIGDVNWGYLWSWTECNGATLYMVERTTHWDNISVHLDHFYNQMCLARAHPDLRAQIHSKLRFGPGEKRYITGWLWSEIAATTTFIAQWNTQNA